MNELPEDLARAFRALDARAGRRAERVDPSRVAARVLERLRDDEAPARRVFSLAPAFRFAAPRYWAVAAALAVLVIGGTVARTVIQGGSSRSVAVPVAFQALDSLSQTQLETVLQVAGQVRPVATESATSSGSSLEGLNEQQLRALLQAVQQSEGGTL